LALTDDSAVRQTSGCHIPLHPLLRGSIAKYYLRQELYEFCGRSAFLILRTDRGPDIYYRLCAIAHRPCPRCLVILNSRVSQI